jgi:hypothetical protein
METKNLNLEGTYVEISPNKVSSTKKDNKVIVNDIWY